jgi:hypothetical protein
MPGPDGVTKRDHLKSVARQTKRQPKALLPRPFPHNIQYLWKWFRELSDARGYSSLGPHRIGYLDIVAWCWLFGTKPEPWELRAILQLDAEWMIVRYPQKTPQSDPAPSISSSPRRKKKGSKHHG